MGDLAISIPEAAARIGVGRTLVWEAAVRGELRTIQLGRRRLVRPADLDRWLDSRAAGGSAAALAPSPRRRRARRAARLHQEPGG